MPYFRFDTEAEGDAFIRALDYVGDPDISVIDLEQVGSIWEVALIDDNSERADKFPADLSVPAMFPNPPDKDS